MADRSRSNVIVIGAGIAGLAATLRLLERGFRVTLLERNNWLGGKLGAHQTGGAGGDFHEHSYHMYLNWYHNFWRITDEIGARKHFEAQHSMGYLRRGSGDWAPRLVRNIDVGQPETAYRNLMSGLRSPADMFLYGYALIDLLGTPVWHYEALDKMSVLSFLNSRHYLTRSAMSIQEDISLKAFASPNFLTAVQSFRKFISFGYCCPSPMMWLLRGNTQQRLFGPLEEHLYRVASHEGASRRLEIRRLHEVRRLCLTDASAIERIEGMELASSPADTNPDPCAKGDFALPVGGDVILAVPPQSVADLVDEAVFAHAPHLAAVRRMDSQPMISFDLYFKKPLALPSEVVGLLNSRFALSFLDTSRLWTNDRDTATFINVVASDALPISGYSPHMIRRLLIQELMEYLPFTTEDVDFERCQLQTNTTEELFTNEVGSWGLRPAATCGIPNLFLAGDYCRNPIDVVTIEGAVASGLLAAEAIRARAGMGTPIEIIEPNTAPEWVLASLKLAGLPYAHLAKAISTFEHWLRESYREVFPKG
ncbi:MAG TPA: FAD-dependent oxidoreductase [Acetobacteraceae bacterium]|nr:FAD-dependent oxidoreductase [Acetobacteraceae bacterium]